MFYAHQLISEEVGADVAEMQKFALSKVRIAKWTMIGVVRVDGEDVCSFRENPEGDLVFVPMRKGVQPEKGWVRHADGVVMIVWPAEVPAATITVDYEY